MADVKILIAHGAGHIDLALARSFGRAGAYVIAGSPLGRGLARHSRYAREVLPFTSFDAKVICGEIRRFVRDGGVTHLIVPEESLIVLLNEHREELERHCVLLFPNNEQFAECLHKERTLARAERLGVPVSKTTVIEHWDGLENCWDWNYPVVFKPAHRDPRYRDSNVREYLVEYANSFEELRWKIVDRGLPSEPTMIQEYASGEGVGVEVLMRAGEPVLMFQHRRLREKPATGGISVYCESMEVSPLLGDYALRLLRDMNWEGPAMVEFKYDPATQRATLIEVNGRFWGSLPLALHAGVDFPAEHLRCLLDPAYRPEPKAYPAGLRCRSLWHDAAALLETWRTGNRPRLRAIAGFLAAFSPRNLGYVWDWRDQGPAWSRIERFVPRWTMGDGGVLRGRKGTL